MSTSLSSSWRYSADPEEWDLGIIIIPTQLQLQQQQQSHQQQQGVVYDGDYGNPHCQPHATTMELALHHHECHHAQQQQQQRTNGFWLIRVVSVLFLAGILATSSLWPLRIASSSSSSSSSFQTSLDDRTSATINEQHSHPYHHRYHHHYKNNGQQQSQAHVATTNSPTIQTSGNGSHPRQKQPSGLEDASLRFAEDVNPDPHVFETTLTAMLSTVQLQPDDDDNNNNNNHAITIEQAWTWNGIMPGPQIRVQQGDRVIVHVRNRDVPVPVSIHWHGLVGNNAADGTAVSMQAHFVSADGGINVYTYDFIAANPGTHWYHSHHETADAIMHGLYGALIIESSTERALQQADVLPREEVTLIVSDIRLEYDSDSNYHHDGTTVMAQIPSVTRDVTELERMNGSEGDMLLVNGRIRPQLVTASTNKPVMLRLINASISRYWHLSVVSMDNNINNPPDGGGGGGGGGFIRVGGQQGLLPVAVQDGGMDPDSVVTDLPAVACQTDDDCWHADSKHRTCIPWNRGDKYSNSHNNPNEDDANDNTWHSIALVCGTTMPFHYGYPAGDVVLAPGMRTVVVFHPKPGMALHWNDYDRGMHFMKMAPPPSSSTSLSSSSQEQYQAMHHSMQSPSHSHDQGMNSMNHDTGAAAAAAAAAAVAATAAMATKSCTIDEDCSDPEYPTCMLMMQGQPAVCGAMIDPDDEDVVAAAVQMKSRPPVPIMTVYPMDDNDDSQQKPGGQIFQAGTLLLDHPIVQSLSLSSPSLEQSLQDSAVDRHWTGPVHRINFRGGMNASGAWFTIDDVSWRPGHDDDDDNSADGTVSVPASRREAALGEVIEFEVFNGTDMHHPFHLHGFSFQPLFFVHMWTTTGNEGWMHRYSVSPTTEFVDTVNIPARTSVIARMRLNDPVGNGAALGRWLFHCHIVQHAQAGMISELFVHK